MASGTLDPSGMQHPMLKVAWCHKIRFQAFLRLEKSFLLTDPYCKCGQYTREGQHMADIAGFAGAMCRRQCATPRNKTLIMDQAEIIFVMHGVVLHYSSFRMDVCSLKRFPQKSRQSFSNIVVCWTRTIEPRPCVHRGQEVHLSTRGGPFRLLLPLQCPPATTSPGEGLPGTLLEGSCGRGKRRSMRNRLNVGMFMPASEHETLIPRRRGKNLRLYIR